MNHPSTVKELLHAEALNDLAKLTDRLEIVVPKVDASRRALLESSEAIANGDRRVCAGHAQVHPPRQGAGGKVRGAPAGTGTISARETQRKVMEEAAQSSDQRKPRSHTPSGQ